MLSPPTPALPRFRPVDAPDFVWCSAGVRLRLVLITLLAAILATPAHAATRPRLTDLLVTGDSMSVPLNQELYLALAPHGVHVFSDPQYGGGISTDFVFDWPAEAAKEATKLKPDATVVFIGANEGFPLTGRRGRKVHCCGPRWEALYANRVRRMMRSYRRGGLGRIYWITVPALRDARRTRIGKVVNAAIAVAAKAYPDQVRLIDGGAIFTPDGYRDSMPVDGVDTVVREPDGMHLNEAGARVLSGAVVATLLPDFTLPDE
jgi:hypothetical protein